MDISEILSLTKFFLPVFVACTIYLVAMRVRPRWLRFSIKSFASVLFGFGMLLVFGLVVVQTGCTKRPPPIYSPDRRHLAIISYAFQGALGDDYATVRVRRSWTPWASVAYFGEGSWDFENNRPADPEVQWLDSAHLLIRYHDNRSELEQRTYPVVCRTQIGSVEVVCEQATSALGQ